jgi:hypothetical protein
MDPLSLVSTVTVLGTLSGLNLYLTVLLGGAFNRVLRSLCLLVPQDFKYL